jgi:hypothetical protein
VNYISGDSNTAYELLYGGVSDHAVSQVQAQIESLATAGIGLASSFIDATKNLFQRVASHDVLRAARRAVAGVASLISGDNITALTTMEEFQLAKPQMRRWLSADSFFREQLENLTIAAWGESFTVNQPGVSGIHNYDHRLSTSGLVFVDEETEKWYRTQYFNQLKDGDVELQAGQIFDIRRSCINFRHLYLKGGEDPTSEFGEML